jgi:hypothetical protein
VNRDLAQAVRERAGERCEYCLVPQSARQLRFQIDHIIAEQHGGETVLDNLALACPHCNRYKGPNIAGLDSQSGQLVRLFHPRTDDWIEHFQFVKALLVGKTPVGRATVQVLAMNEDEPLRFRMALIQAGVSLS